MPFSIIRVGIKTQELGNDKMKVLYIKRLVVKTDIDNGKVQEIKVTEVWNVGEFYDYSNGEHNVLKNIADKFKFGLGAMHHDDEGDTRQPVQ